MTAYRCVTPRSLIGSRYSSRVKCTRYSARSFTCSEAAEDFADNFRLGFVDLALAGDRATGRIHADDNILPETSSSTALAHQHSAFEATTRFLAQALRYISPMSPLIDTCTSETGPSETVTMPTFTNLRRL